MTRKMTRKMTRDEKIAMWRAAAVKADARHDAGHAKMCRANVLEQSMLAAGKSDAEIDAALKEYWR